MNTKLTLKLKKDIIEKAKAYASSQKISLSKIVESYLESITNTDIQLEREDEISPFIKSMKTGVKLPSEIDDKKIYRDYLEEKHK